jgi:diaminohydroxyphosphoribosylaminopyrimidine deaminase / 5-amino-6-(5-phosphoribosylamino)uracil reductase
MTDKFGTDTFEADRSALADSLDCDALERDQRALAYCCDLARRAAGRTAPNPLVGALIVREIGAAWEIVGQGFHPGAGQPHAEVFALAEAGERSRGATVYVSLEPCNHYGRTPPCTEALIAAGVARVVVGMVDPDPRVSGAGIDRLRAAGIEVLLATGAAAVACRRLNEAFVHRVTQGRPFGILKYAMTLDGKIAASTGHSAWVTSPEARRWVHRLRSTCDAVIIGGNTLRQDNPALTTHGVTDHNPLRVVLSRGLALPEEAQLWTVEQARTLVITEAGVRSDLQARLRDRGVEVVELVGVSPQGAMAVLQERGLMQVLWECGGGLAAGALAAGLIQKVAAFVAPKIIGGAGASPVGELGLARMTEALELVDLEWRMIGPDLLCEGYVGAGDRSAAP